MVVHQYFPKIYVKILCKILDVDIMLNFIIRFYIVNTINDIMLMKFRPALNLSQL